MLTNRATEAHRCAFEVCLGDKTTVQSPHDVKALSELASEVEGVGTIAQCAYAAFEK